MHDTEPSGDEKYFFEEVSKSLHRLAVKYGYKIPPFNCMAKDGAVFMNVTAFYGNPEDYYRKWYLAHADQMGLEEAWPGAKFSTHDKSRKLELLGLDPDGGDACLRVRDEKGVDSHITPSALVRLILESE